MRTGAHQSQFVAGDAVDQEPVRLDVCFPVSLPDSPERVIEMACRQWFLPVRRWIALWMHRNLVPSPLGVGRASEAMRGPVRVEGTRQSEGEPHEIACALMDGWPQAVTLYREIRLGTDRGLVRRGSGSWAASG